MGQVPSSHVQTEQDPASPLLWPQLVPSSQSPMEFVAQVPSSHVQTEQGPPSPELPLLPLLLPELEPLLEPLPLPLLLPELEPPAELSLDGGAFAPPSPSPLEFAPTQPPEVSATSPRIARTLDIAARYLAISVMGTTRPKQEARQTREPLCGAQ